MRKNDKKRKSSKKSKRDRPVKKSKRDLQTEEALFFKQARKEAEEYFQEEKERLENLKTLDLEMVGDDPHSKINLIQELMRLGRTVLLEEEAQNLPREKREGFLSPKIRDRVRKIGEELWEQDPYSGTGPYVGSGQDVLRWFFSCDLLSFPKWTRRGLEFVWDGIGDFKC